MRHYGTREKIDILKKPGSRFHTPTFFIYDAILIRFEIQHFHMFTNKNRGQHLKMGLLFRPYKKNGIGM